jgi:AmmeMemoRadiSam system protein B/AmmeMemoRadiSam system protein A
MKLKNGVFFFLVFFFFLSLMSEEKVREYLKTGDWYPSGKSELSDLMNQLFSRAEKVDIPGNIVGIVSPHAGFAYSGLCAAMAYRQLEGNPQISRVIILGTSHHAGFYGACVSDFTHLATPLGKLEVDRQVVDKLAAERLFRLDNRVMLYEHSIENQLPFIQTVFKNRDIRVVPILFGQLDHKDYPVMARIIGNFIDSATLVVASSDLDHYGQNFGYTPFSRNIKANLTRLDTGMIENISRLDIDGYFRYKEKTGITMCGFVPVGVLLYLYPARGHGARLTDYRKSGDRNQDYSLSVSYASLVIWQKKPGHGGGGNRAGEIGRESGLSATEKKDLLSMARDTLRLFFQQADARAVIEKKYRISDNLKKELGVFVTLKKNQQLRGCIGSLIGRKPLYLEVMDEAINAAVRDPRFIPVKQEELPGLKIEISVMTPLQKITDYKRIRLGIDGVIIKSGYSQAVYLPQVATETGWNLDEFLSHLCEKAGLASRAYRSPDTEFYVFQAQVFGED